jgi:drug/metabolite transporter (DMT)-like permease
MNAGSSSIAQRQGVFGLGAGALLLGTLGICVRETGLDPVTIVFWRCIIGGAVLAVYCAWHGHFRTQAWTLRILGLAGLSGALMVGNWVLFFAAIQRTGIAVSTIVFHVQPFFVVLLGALIFGERIELRKMAAVGVAFAGLVLATDAGGRKADFAGSYATGMLCAIVGAFLYAWVTLIAKRLGALRPHLLTLIQCAVGAPLLLALVPAPASGIAAAQWGWLVAIGAIHTAFVYALIYGALPKLTTPVIAVLLFLYPLSAILVDFAVYGTRIAVTQALGFALILGASLAITADLSPRRAARRVG